MKLQSNHCMTVCLIVRKKIMVSALNVAICFMKFDIKAIFRYMFGVFWRLNKMKSQRVVVSETAEGLKISGGGGTNNNRNLFDAKSLQRRVAYSSSIGNRHHPTISSHFFAIYINIFHKTEIQTVILRCLVSLNLNWIKSYGIILVKIIFFMPHLRASLWEREIWHLLRKSALIFLNDYVQTPIISGFKGLIIRNL